MVDRNILTASIEAIEKHLLSLSTYAKLSRKDFLSDLNVQDIVEYNLFQIVNHLIDMLQHIVVDENLGFPESAYDAVELLHARGFLSHGESEILRRMIGFRNIVGHDYIDLNKETVHEILTNGQQDINNILSAITKNFFR
ncbi:MAG TPA: DUF86 domain-containing protein [Syntrophorhabdaceae bacterium]|nr:DUF86 domain-containing protein [Syntrophorhabdaceae bacterium]